MHITRKDWSSITAIQPNKTSFTPRHTITGKGIAYIKPLDPSLPLRLIEIEFENNRCCIKIHNTSNSTVEFLHGQEMAYFDARSKGLVQTNNSKHFPIDQYLHGRMTPATLSPTPLAYEKPIHPTEMPCITTCTELSVDDTNKSTSDNKYPWLDSDDIRRNMTDKEILQMKLNLKDSVLDEKGKEEFLANVEQFTDVFSLRDEIGTCPFIEVHLKQPNVTKGNRIWAHFASTRCFPSQIQMSRPIQKEDVQIETFCCIFKCIRINWSSIIVTGISGTMITMPDIAYVSIFTDNELTNIREDHFETKLIARLLDQIYILYSQLCSHQGMMMHHYKNMNIHSHILVQMVQDHRHLSSQNICIRYLPAHKHRVWLYNMNLLYIGFMMTMI